MTAERPAANTNYSPNPWMQSVPPIQKKPSYFNSDDQARYEALMEDLVMSADDIRQIRPRVGNVPFPPRTGYTKEEPTIMDVMTLGTATLMNDTPTRQDSGQPGYGGPALGQW